MRRSGLAGKLHTVTAPDNSVSIGVPDGWTVDPGSGHGTIIAKGPQGEVVAFGMMRNAVDSSSQWQQNFWRMGGKPIPGTILYPYHGNLTREFPNLVQAWRRAGGLGPAKLQVEKIEQMPPPQGGPQGEECVNVKGQLDPDGNGMRSWTEMMCATLPANEWRGYMVIRHQSLFPNSLADRQKPTVQAMVPTLNVNADVMNQQNAELMRRKQADDAQIRAQTQQAINNIHAIGAQATARYNATQAANDAQHAGYWAQQDTNARTNQAFSNYHPRSDRHPGQQHVRQWHDRPRHGLELHRRRAGESRSQSLRDREHPQFLEGRGLLTFGRGLRTRVHMKRIPTIIAIVAGLATAGYWAWTVHRTANSGETRAKVEANLPPLTLEQISSLDQKTFERSLPQLRQAMDQPSPKAVADQQTLAAIEVKLRQCGESTPEYWPTVLRFIQFASSRMAPKRHHRGSNPGF